MKVLILGSNGMLGNAFLQTINKYSDFDAYGTVRKNINIKKIDSLKIFDNINCENFLSLENIIYQLKPSVIVNCIGLVKQHSASENPIKSILINSLFPHKVFELCQKINARFIQISTDCVFSGTLGDYTEDDFADPQDIYGRSKLLGEINNSGSITLRTSIIGHSLYSNHGLIDWFLTQKDNIKGYKKAIFSGLTTFELSKIIIEYVIPNAELSGIYHVSSSSISKYDLLNLVRKIYKKSIEISPDDNLVIDRSLNSEKFKQLTHYDPPSWENMIQEMYLLKNEQFF